jgi:imidazolonepropionase-like amidohydrolase
MKIILAFIITGLLCSGALAQNLVITNGKVIDGTGRVLDRGSVLVEDGRIVSVSEGDGEARGGKVIDARGMTVMPGLIDTHVHMLIGMQGPDNQAMLDQWIETRLPGALKAHLAAGFTTLGSNGDFLEEILDVRERLENGQLKGPRLLTAGRAFTAPGGHPSSTVCVSKPFCVRALSVEVTDTTDARENVRKLVAAGVDSIKMIYDDDFVPGHHLDREVMAAIVDEAKRLNIPSTAHITSSQDALHVAEAGIVRLVHFASTGGAIDRETMGVFREIPISTTSHMHAPLVDATGKRINHTYDPVGKPIGHDYTAKEEGRMNENLANIRLLWDIGGLVAFGTDHVTDLDRSTVTMHEIETLSRILSPEEIVTAITRNAAIYLGVSDETGTLEPGKFADIILIDGDPLANPMDLANVKLVVRNGEVVLDMR